MRGKKLRQGSYFVLPLFSFIVIALALAACGGGDSSPSSSPPPSTGASGTLAVEFGDAPLDNLVKFEITVVSIALNPGNVEILPQPVRVEVSSLQLTTDLVRLAQNIPAGNYDSVTLQFSDPQIKFCPDSAPCTTVREIEPPLQNVAVIKNINFSIAANTTTGLLVDFDLQASVVADVGGTIIGINPVLTCSVVNLAAEVDEFEAEGRVVSVNRTNSTSGTFVFEPFGICQQVTITVDANTEFADFDEEASLANSFDSLAVNQIVDVDADIQSGDALLATEVEMEDDAMEDEIEGLITRIINRNGSDQVTQFEMVLFDVAPCTASLPAEDIVTVNVPTDGSVEFRIDEDGLPVDTSLFDDPRDLEVGQKVDVDPQEALGTNPVTAEKIKLEDQTIRGSVLSTSDPNFQLDPAADLFPDQSILVETGADTRFDDLPNGVGSLSAVQLVRVKGLLFRIGTDEQKIVAKRVDGTP
jgi:hypothetical protein